MNFLIGARTIPGGRLAWRLYPCVANLEEGYEYNPGQIHGTPGVGIWEVENDTLRSVHVTFEAFADSIGTHSVIALDGINYLTEPQCDEIRRALSKLLHELGGPVEET